MLVHFPYPVGATGTRVPIPAPRQPQADAYDDQRHQERNDQCRDDVWHVLLKLLIASVCDFQGWKVTNRAGGNADIVRHVGSPTDFDVVSFARAFLPARRVTIDPRATLFPIRSYTSSDIDRAPTKPVGNLSPTTRSSRLGSSIERAGIGKLALMPPPVGGEHRFATA